MTRRARVLLSAVVVLSSSIALSGALACAGPGGAARSAARAKHPPSDPSADCAECHARTTPAVVEEWNASAHGVALVKCLVCHGSTGADFTLLAEPSRCAGCHDAEVASTAAASDPRGCFACHGAHRLAAPSKPNPHAK